MEDLVFGVESLRALPVPGGADSKYPKYPTDKALISFDFLPISLLPLSRGAFTLSSLSESNMQKLLLSFKLLSKIPQNLSHEPYLCKNIIYSLTETNAKHLLHHSPTQPHSLSHFCFSSSSRSCRSHHNMSERLSGVLGNPIAVNQLLRNTHLKFQTRGFHRLLIRRNPFERLHSVTNPRRSWSRLWKSWFPTTESVVLGLISANIAVFFLWRIADMDFMRKNFMISVNNITSGRLHTLVTSAFSHVDARHLFSNMFGLYFFGTSMGRTLGPHFVLKLYLAGAVGGSIFYLIHHALQRPGRKGSGIFGYVDPWATPGLGASGAVNAIILLDVFLFPKSIYYLYLMIPVPAVLMGAAFIGTDLWRVMKGNSHVSGSAHLGGAAVAALAWLGLRRRLF